MSFKDIAKRTIEIGDIVAFNPPTYKGLVKGVVKKFTPQMVTVAFSDNNGNDSKTNIYPRDCAVLYKNINNFEGV